MKVNQNTADKKMNADLDVDDGDDIFMPIPLKEKDEEEEEAPPPPPQGAAVVVMVTEVVDLAWLVDYKVCMSRAIHLVQSLVKSERRPPDWLALQCDDAMYGDRVQLHERMTIGGVVASAIVRGRAERYAYAARDYETETRLAWDGRHTYGPTAVTQVETYHCEQPMCMVQQRSPALVPGAADRWLQGLLTHFYNEYTRTHTVVVCSASHPHYECPADAVPVVGATLGVVVRQLDAKHCELLLVAHYNDVGSAVGGYSPIAGLYASRLKENVRERVTLFEDAVVHWKRYYGPKRDPKKVGDRK